MRQKEPAEKRKGWKKRLGAGLTAAGLLAALAVQPVFAAGEEKTPYQEVLEKGLSVTVTAPSDGDYEELKDAGVVLDIYRIAAAEEIEGYDAYEFADDWGIFSAQKTAWDAAVEKAKADKETKITAGDLETLAQGAAAAVLKDVPEYTPGRSGEEVKTNADYHGVLQFSGSESSAAVMLQKADGTPDPGLYLIIAHGVPAGYRLNENGKLYTVAEGKTTLFEFAPMLVSVPVRGQEVFAGSVKVLDSSYDSSIGDTAAGDAWTGNITMQAKVGVKDRLGSLKITKTLNTHEIVDFGGRNDPATFVFDVNVKDKDGKEVYANVISMVFDGAGGPQEKIISGLPIGAMADVTEVYAGNYKTSQKYTGIEIKGDEITTAADGTETRVINTETAAFTNDWNDTWDGGGSVTNTYETAEKTNTDGTESVEWDLNDGKVKQSYALETAGGASQAAK